MKNFFYTKDTVRKELRFRPIFLLVSGLIGLALIISVEMLNTGGEHKIRTDVWRPWLEFDPRQFTSVTIEPMLDPYRETIPKKIEINEIQTIVDIKAAMNRKPYKVEDLSGDHWSSRQVVTLRFHSEKQDFLFLLGFHSSSPSVKYHFGNCYGVERTSHDLYMILSKYIDPNDPSQWVFVEG